METNGVQEIEEMDGTFTGFSLKRINHDSDEEIRLKIGSLAVGRDPKSDIFLDSNQCSRHHCTLDVRKYVVWLIDRVSSKMYNYFNLSLNKQTNLLCSFQSTCGTFVNDIKLQNGTQILKENDKIGFGVPTDLRCSSTFVYQFIKRTAEPMDVDSPDRSKQESSRIGFYPEINELRTQALRPKTMRTFKQLKDYFGTECDENHAENVETVEQLQSKTDDENLSSQNGQVEDEEMEYTNVPNIWLSKKEETLCLKSILKKENRPPTTPMNKKQVVIDEGQSTIRYFEKDSDQYDSSSDEQDSNCDKYDDDCETGDL